MGGHDGGGARRGHRRRAITGSGRRATPWARHLPAARRRRRAGDVGRCPARQRDGHRVDRALSSKLRAEGCVRLWLTMTNANLSALQFYLRRGFRLRRVRPGAVDNARKLKPSIPVVGEHGIPVRDELDLCRVLDPNAQDVRALAPWSELRPDPIAAARHGYAEELRCTASIREPAVVKAFATVPREHFLGPGPWRILSPMSTAKYWTTDNAD